MESSHPKQPPANCIDTYAWSETPASGESDHGVYTGGAELYFNAEGTRSKTTFAYNELKAAFASPCVGLVAKSIVARFKAGQSSLGCTSILNRIERCHELISNARTFPDLGIRVAMYAVCLEVLFSTNATELSHKLAERCAFFLEDNPSSRLRVYELVKNIYRVRSKVFHGDILKPADVATLASLSVASDDLLRSVMRKVYEHEDNAALFLDKPDLFDDYFLRLSMGIGSV